jgi:small-conductance mechanosensitive channel
VELLQIAKDLLPLEKVVRQGAKAIITILIAWVLYLIVRRAVRASVRAARGRIEEEAHSQRVATLLLLLGSVAKYVIIFFAGIMVLRDIGINPTPVLAGAGILGLGVGFGAQNLVRDVVSGFFIIMEGQYAVGDLVEINGVFGQVEEVGLRITKLRDPNGEVRYFANGTIVTANNYTEDYVAHVVNIPLPREAPADPIRLVSAILDDFDKEFGVFVRPASIETHDLPSYARLVRAQTRSVPGRHLLVEQKLPPRLASALERAGHPLPAGTEISISLQYPPPGLKA